MVANATFRQDKGRTCIACGQELELITMESGVTEFDQWWECPAGHQQLLIVDNTHF